MILKKKRIIQLSIYKGADWYRDDETQILKPTKIPLTRLPVKCGRRCEFSGICSFWAPQYRLEGIRKRMSEKYPTYTISEYTNFCDCTEEGNFEYIFTYEDLRHYIPLDVLKKIGLYREPKITKKPIFFDNPPKNYNPRNSKYSGGGNRNYKNYNSRKR